MGGYYPALAVNPPPNLGDQLARAVQLRSLIGEQQLQQIQIQNAQADQQAYKAANQQWQPNAQGQYDHSDFIDLMRKNGATAQTVLGLQQAQLKMDETAALTRKNNLDAAAQQAKIDADNHEKTAADLENLKPANTPPEQYEAARDRQLQQWVQSGRMSAQEAAQYANTPQSAVEGLQKHVLGLKTYSDVQKAQADTEKAKQDANLAKMKAGPIDVDTSNQRATARYQQYHPNESLPTYLTLPPGANLLQEELRDKNLEALEKAEAVKQNTQLSREATAAQRAQTNVFEQQRLDLAQQKEKETQQQKGMKWASYTEPGTGRTIAGPVSSIPPGVTDAAEIQGKAVDDIREARNVNQLITKQGDPSKPESMGVLQLIDSLDKDKKLGIVSSRLNSFLTGKVGTLPGDDPRIAALLNKADLAMTASMKAHFGASGGRSPQMLEHFLQMADARKMDAGALRSGFKAVNDYMKDRGAMPSGTGGTYAGPPAAPPAAGKILSRSALQQAAKDHGVSEQEAERQARAAGYNIQ